MRYEITDSTEVLLFIDPQAEPVLAQPYDPATGNAFKGAADAEKWAKAQVKAWQDSQLPADYVAPVPTES